MQDPKDFVEPASHIFAEDEWTVTEFKSLSPLQ